MDLPAPAKPPAPKLLPRERRFVREYLVDFCGSRAIVRAGFKGERPDVAAAKMLAKPAVRAALEERQRQVEARLDITVERVLKEQAAIAFSDPRALFDENGAMKPVHELDDAAAAALAAIEVEELFEGSGESRERVGRLHKVKRWDKQKALEHLSRFLGMVKPDDDNRHPVGPGLVVVVQQSATAGGDAAAAAQRVAVNLPRPARGG